MDYLFLHRDKRTFTSERQKNLLFRAARLYWEQKYADSEVVPKRKVDCELYKYGELKAWLQSVMVDFGVGTLQQEGVRKVIKNSEDRWNKKDPL